MNAECVFLYLLSDYDSSERFHYLKSSGVCREGDYAEVDFMNLLFSTPVKLCSDLIAHAHTCRFYHSYCWSHFCHDSLQLSMQIKL